MQNLFDRLTNLFPGRKLKKEQLEQLRYLLNKAVSDGIVTDEEIREIDSYLGQSELSSEDFYEIKNAVLNDVMASYCSDRRVSPEEAQSLRQIATQLGFSDESLQLIDQHIRFYSLMDFVENCPQDRLPTTSATGIVLQRGEVAYYSAPASLMEERVVSRDIVGRSHGVGIPIMKGVRYRVGQSRGQLVSKTGIVAIASGNFTVTNKRIIFAGDRKSVNAPYNKVLDINVFSDAIRFSLTSRQKPVYVQFLTTNTSALAAMYISRMING